MIWTAVIRKKLPSLNDYINICRRNRYEAANYKKKLEEQIAEDIQGLPFFDAPITIHFHWVEGNKRRDYDNIAFAKKFILDALVKSGKLKDDNRKHVQGFRDSFGYDTEFSCVLEIEEV